jgi:branched-chain amino acid transport system permease protein
MESLKEKPAFGAEVAAIAVLLLVVVVPVATSDLFVYSLTNQFLIAVTAAFSVYIMLRMDLLSFAVPAFMAIGGYAAAIAAKGGATNLVLLIAVSFAVPALVALPLGVLVLRLKGVYFVLVTFIFTEILQLLIFETPGLSGGSNGIAGVPAATIAGVTLGSNRMVVYVTLTIAVLAAIITAVVTRTFRQEFAAIEENETLAESLGLVVWRYRTIGFVVAAGIAGIGGFALVNMLLTAHPTSFSSMSGVNYIAYTIVGGRSSILGPILGSGLLVWASNIFSSQGAYSAGLFGLLIIAAATIVPGGIVGTFLQVVRAWRGRARPVPAAERTEG